MDQGTESAYNEVIKNQKADPTGRVLLYGYSYGGTLVNHLAKRLEKAGVKVNIMVTVDAANGWGSDNVDRTIGSNVEKTENYYQENVSFGSDPTMSHGGANSGKYGQVNNHNKSKDKSNGKLVNHMSIDDVTINDVIKSINDVLNSMKDGEKKTLTKYEINKLGRTN